MTNTTSSSLLASLASIYRTLQPPIVVMGLFFALAIPYISPCPPSATRFPKTAALIKTDTSASERPPGQTTQFRLVCNRLRQTKTKKVCLECSMQNWRRKSVHGYFTSGFFANSSKLIGRKSRVPTDDKKVRVKFEKTIDKVPLVAELVANGATVA